MKNKVMVVFLAFSILCFFVFFGFVASADDTSAFDERTKEVYESFSFQNVISLLYNSVKQAFFRSIPVFSGLVGMIFVSSVINALGLCFERFDVGEYVCSLCFSGFLFSVIKNLCDSIENYIEKIRDICAVSLPPIVASCMSDGVMTVISGNSAAALSVAVIEFLVSSLVLPCAKLLFVLMTVSAIVGKTLDVKGFSSSIRTFSVFCSAFLMTACVTVIHFQDAVARAADSVGNRAVRFAATNLVPIVGNLVSESISTVSQSMRAVGTVTGAAGVAAIISATLPPLVACVVFKIELNLGSILAKILGCPAQSSMLSEAGGILNVLNAGLIISSVGFSLMLCLVSNII